MQKHDIQDCFQRLINKGYEETELGQTLDFLPKLSENGPWLAGGAIRKTLAGEVLDSDYDFFFKDEEQMKRASEFLGCHANFISVKENEYNKCFKLFSQLDHLKEITIQLIHFQYYETLEECLNSFDYTICQMGFDGTNLVFGDYTLYDFARKRLVVNKITYPVGSLRRLIKYTKQGFYACDGTLGEFLQTVIDNRDDLNFKVTYID